MKRRGLATLAVGLLVACSTGGPEVMVIESGRFPGVSIECGGEPGLTEAECRKWAESLLATAPKGTAKLVLTHRTGNARCAADHFAANGRMLMTAAARCPGS